MPYCGKRFWTHQIPTSCCQRAGVSQVSISSQFILLCQYGNHYINMVLLMSVYFCLCQHGPVCVSVVLRDRPFNLKGGVMVFCFVQKFFFGQHKNQNIYFFYQAKREIFFQISTLGYMTKTLKNQIIFFFLHQNQNIFYSNIGNQNIFLEKKHNDISIPFCHHLYLSATLKQCFTEFAKNVLIFKPDPKNNRPIKSHVGIRPRTDIST